MRYNRAAVLSLVFLTAFVGIIDLSLVINGIPANDEDIQILTNDAPIHANTETTVTEWDDILYGTFFIPYDADIEFTSSSSLDYGDGLNKEGFNPGDKPDYIPEKSMNATNLITKYKLYFEESFNISVIDTNGNMTGIYYPSHPMQLENMEHIKIYNENYTRLYQGRNVSWGDENTTRPDHWINEEIVDYNKYNHYWTFNMSRAVQLIEGKAAYNGSNYVFEFGFYIVVTLAANDPKISSIFSLEGTKTEQMVNYSFKFKFDSPVSLNASFIFLPADSDKIIGTPKFSRTDLSGNILNASYTAILQDNYDGNNPAWFLQGSFFPLKPEYYLVVNYSVNFTIEFTNMYTERWTCDRLTYRTSGRRRTLSLNISDGPEDLLVENINFTLTNMNFDDFFNQVKLDAQFEPRTTPYSGKFISRQNYGNNTYRISESAGGPYDDMPNGTWFNIHKMQKSQGVMLFDFWYEASHNYTLRITDEVNNPLPGAEVYMFYQGKPYGVKMAENDSLINPPKISNNLGFIELNNIPAGEYDLEIVYGEEIVGTYSFSTDNLQNGQLIVIVTSVPYQPTILIGWLIVCSFIFIIGVYYLKKKR
ncbi:MAG: hypothetical protein ACFFCS_00515 [Candidatus Hodarchaeota archaeon]